MTERGTITLNEIMSQPDIWAQTLDVFAEHAAALTDWWRSEQFEQVILTGCGSTYYLAMIGAELIQAATGVPARAFTASELMLYPETHLASPRKTLLLPVSRSGVTRESVEAARLFHQFGRGAVLVVTCHGDSPLAVEADRVVALDHAREDSRVQTRSFSSMMLTLMALAPALAGRDELPALRTLPDHLARLFQQYGGSMRSLGADRGITQFAFLASGPLYGLAAEVMLKMTEMSHVFSTAFHTLEYLHGPRYVLDDGALVIAMVADAAYDEDVAALRQLADRGVRLLILADEARGGTPEGWSTLITLESGLPVQTGALLYLPLLQLVAHGQGVSRGYDPDNLNHPPVAV